MDIVDVLQPFSASVCTDCAITITIGKYSSAADFYPNNKLFFDFLKVFLNKNGWFIAQQYLRKTLLYGGTPYMLHSTVETKPSVVLGLDMPVTHTHNLVNTHADQTYIYKGTYFDIKCQQCQLVPAAMSPAIMLTTPTKEMHEEVSILCKHLSALKVFFVVEQQSQKPIYGVKVQLSSLTEADKEELRALFDIIEMAMCKYKKIEKTFSSKFM